MKPCQQYFYMVLFVFKHFTKWNFGFVLILILGTLGSEKVKNTKFSRGNYQPMRPETETFVFWDC